MFDIVGKVGTAPPAQIVRDVPKVNVGVMFGVTVTVNVAGTAHWPAVGVKLYVPGVVLLTTAGFQAPVIPFVELLGKVGTVPPAQILSDVPKVNAGVVRGMIVTGIVIGIPH